MRRARHNQCRRARVKNRDGVECPGLRLEKMNRNFGPAYLSPSNSRARARGSEILFETLTTPLHQREGESAAPESGEDLQ